MILPLAPAFALVFEIKILAKDPYCLLNRNHHVVRFGYYFVWLRTVHRIYETLVISSVKSSSAYNNSFYICIHNSHIALWNVLTTPMLRLPTSFMNHDYSIRLETNVSLVTFLK
jgi:hypothetical protein